MSRLREDERDSKPLRVGLLPELPGLRGNRTWLHYLAIDKPYSGRAARTTTENYSREWLDICAEMAEDIKAGMAKASMVHFLDKHQFNIDASRPPEQGSSCCALFVCKLVRRFMSGRSLDSLLGPAELKRLLLEAVQEHDASLSTGAAKAADNGGNDVEDLLRQHCKDLPHHVDLDVLNFLDVCTNDLHRAQLLTFLQQMVSVERSAIACTALPCSSKKEFGEQSGDSFAVLGESGVFVVIESHRHYPLCSGQASGLLIAKCIGAENLVDFLYSAVMPMMQCQLRWLHCVRALPRALHFDKMSSSGLKERFAFAAKVCMPWLCKLEDMWDVRIMQTFTAEVNIICHKYNAHRVFNEWFGDAIFFVGHQLSFSALVDVLSQHLSRAKDLWTRARAVSVNKGSNIALQSCFCMFLESLRAPLEAKWQQIRPSVDSSTWDPTFFEECKQLPFVVRRQLGMYAYGMFSWNFQKISFVGIGAALAQTAGIEHFSEEDQAAIARNALLALRKNCNPFGGPAGPKRTIADVGIVILVVWFCCCSFTCVSKRPY
jgi:hypothetical protein